MTITRGYFTFARSESSRVRSRELEANISFLNSSKSMPTSLVFMSYPMKKSRLSCRRN